MKNFPCVLIFTLFAFSLSAKGQEANTIYWRGKIINGDTGNAVPDAVVAVYRTAVLYSADYEGIVRLRLQENDSVRVVVLGYSAETFRIKTLQSDSSGYAIMRIYPVSYVIKEVTVRGKKGIFDPYFFPELKDDSPQVEMNLPNDIGSKMSELPPSERLIFDNRSLLYKLKRPVSLIYSGLSREDKQIRQLRNTKFQENIQAGLSAYISPEAIANLTGFSGQELENFIIYCNARIELHPNDNGVSVTAKIEEIFINYKKGL